MQKIPTMYNRDETRPGHPVIPGVKPECAWVEAGEGIATRKLDGQNVKIVAGQLWKRQKPKDRDYDEASYALCRRDDPGARYLFEAFDRTDKNIDGICEVIGPKIQGNPEHVERHELWYVVPPDVKLFVDAPRTFGALRDWLAAHPYEGVVFHHPDGRMAKIKRRDFGMPSSDR
jgi:hypothetical protein